jgi:hypothetical protein
LYIASGQLGQSFLEGNPDFERFVTGSPQDLSRISRAMRRYIKGGVLFSDDVTKPNASGGFALYW